MRNNNQQQENDLETRLRTVNSNDFSNIRKENFFQFLKNSFCKTLTVFSFTSITTILIYIIFFISLGWGIEKSNESFITPASSSPIMSYFNRNTIKIKYSYEIWRFVTYSFLHYNLPHILFNSITLLIFGSLLENILLWKKMIAIWLFSSFFGGLLSILIQPSSIAVGASASIYGFVGAYVSIFSFIL